MRFILLFFLIMSFVVWTFASDHTKIRVLRNPVMHSNKTLKIKKVEPSTGVISSENYHNSRPVISKTRKTAGHTYRVLVDSSRNGYGWLNPAIRGIDFFKGVDALGENVSFVLLGYRQYLTANTASGIIGATTINVADGLANAGSGDIYRHVQLNQDISSGTLGGRYPGVVALERPFIAFNQYISGDGSSTPTVSSPYLITDYGSYGNNGGAWTPSYRMDTGYTHHDSPGGNRLWNGPVDIVKDSEGTYHYCGVYENWYLDSESQDNDHVIMNASSDDPTSSWTIDTDPTLIDPQSFTMVQPGISINSSGFGVIASAGHDGYHDEDTYYYADLKVCIMVTEDFGATWSAPRTVEWDELGIPTEVTLDDSLEYFVDETTTDFYVGDAYVGTNFDTDVLVSENNDIYIGFNVLWGRPGDDGWYPHYFHTGPHVAVSDDEGESFTAHRVAINNGFFEGDSLIPDMSSVFLDSEIDLGLDEEGNLYAGWLDRPGNPVRLAPKPRYSTSSDPDYKTDVFVARSDDGGVNWSERINLTQSVNNDEYELNMAKTVSSEDNGTAYVTYCIAADPNDNTETYIDGVNMIWVSERKDFVDVTGINDETEPALLKDLSLKQNYPNPFNPSTKIEFTAGVTGQAVMEIYDCTGRKVDEIYNNRVQKNGTYQVTYYAESLAAGVYFYRLTNGSRIAVKKMILLK